MADKHLAPIDAANLLAGQAVAVVTSFLDGRHDWRRLLDDVDRLEAELQGQTEPATQHVLLGVGLLLVAGRGMAKAARACSSSALAAHPFVAERLDRWRNVATALIELVRSDSKSLIGEGQGR